MAERILNEYKQEVSETAEIERQTLRSTNTKHDNPYLGWAKKDAQYTHISQVVSGKKCGCTCIVCNEPLIARKCPNKEDHFAHFPGSDCNYSPETVLHKVAKDVIANSPYLIIPPDIYFAIPNTQQRMKIPEALHITTDGIVHIEGVLIEHEGSRNGFVPDIVIKTKGKQLIIEVCVTNPVNEEKLKKIRQNNEHCIEITLTIKDALLTPDELKRKILDDITCKHWVHHPAQREAEAYLKNLKLQSEINRQALILELVKPRLRYNFSPRRRNWRL